MKPFAPTLTILSLALLLMAGPQQAHGAQARAAASAQVISPAEIATIDTEKIAAAVASGSLLQTTAPQQGSFQVTVTRSEGNQFISIDYN